MDNQDGRVIVNDWLEITDMKIKPGAPTHSQVVMNSHSARSDGYAYVQMTVIAHVAMEIDPKKRYRIMIDEFEGE